MVATTVIEQTIITSESGAKILVETRTTTNADGSKTVNPTSYTLAQLTAASIAASAQWEQRIGVINGTIPPLTVTPGS